MSPRSQSKAHDEPRKIAEPRVSSDVIKDPAILTAAWLSGPHPAALAEIEVADLDEALQLAKTWSALAPGHPVVEIWPVVEE